MIKITVLAVLACASHLVVASHNCKYDPTNRYTLPQQCTAANGAQDPPYTMTEAILANNLYCVPGVQNVKNPILLMPGTGNTGRYDGFSNET